MNLFHSFGHFDECISNCRVGLKSIIGEFRNNPGLKAGVIMNYIKRALAQMDYTRYVEMHPIGDES